MTTVRIAHAEPRPGKLANGGFITRGFLIVLADDVSHRAVPIWMRGEPGGSDLSKLLEIAARPAGEIVMADAPEELTARLVRAAGASVTGVDIEVTAADTDELTPQGAVARIGLAGPAGTREVTADLGLGLAMAAVVGVPVRMADAVLDRVATPVPGDDLLGPFLDWVPPAGRALPGGHAPAGWPMATLPGQRPRYEPRNLAFADSLDGWLPNGTIVTIAGDRDWTSHEVMARVPDDANTVMFGMFLAGRGRIELRRAELTRGA